MKRVMRNFFLAVAVFISMIATAEAQNSFAYQAVIRTAQGELVSNQKVGMRFSLIYNKETVYCETHTPETNKYGNVQVEVGKGQKVSGDFAAVPWSTMQVMMKIEADPAGGTNYIDLGTIQLQPAPYAMYAPTAGMVSTVQAGEPKSDGDALFEVKDKDGNVVFAVYPDGVRVFVDDADSTANKAMSTGFAVQGRRAAKDGGDANIFAVNTSGTQVFVGEEDTAGGKPVSTGFAVQGRRAAKDGSSDLFKVSSTGTQIYIGEQDSKPVSTGFAVQGRRAAKDGENDKYLEINPDGTRVYIDDADSVSGKPVSTGFAVQGRRAAKGDSDSKYLEINANGTQVFVDDTDDKPVSTGFAVQGRRAAKGNEPKLFEVNQYGTQIYIDTKKGKPVSTGFAVQGRRAGKNANTNKYMVIDADGTRVYVDYEEAKAMQTGFAVQGRRAAKDGAQNTILEVNNVDGTRVYIDDIDGKAMPTGFAVSGRRAGKEDNNFLDINNNKITLANKQLAVGNTTTEANTLVMTGESTTIVTDVFLLAEKETEEPLLIADNKSGVDVNTNLVVRGEVGQNVKTEEVEDAAPDTIMVASVIETLACAELAAALGDADGYALLKIHGNGLFTQPQELDAAGNTSILFDVYGKMTTYRESAVVAVIMTNAATPDAKVLIWPLKQTNGTNISFGLTTVGGTDQYVNVLACINAKGGVECKFNAIASDSNLGEVKVEGTKVYGDVVRIEATTIKKGYHFAGWSDGVGTNPRSVMVAGDSTITALFEPNPYNVTLTATNGHIEGAESGIFHYGTKLTLEAVADDHYHFVGWSNGSTDNPYTLEVENNLELTANFEINKYIVTFHANGGVFAEGAASTSKVTYNRPIGAFPAVERKGYIFTGWADYKGDSFVEETLVTDTVTLYAQWLQTTYYVADADNNGSADGDGTSENPYASINNALEEMITNGTDTVYTICVKGTLAKDNTVIPEDLNGKIRRLIIEGDGGQMEINESTGESQYVPGGTLTIASEYGRVLGVETSVPVTLRNITITGGELSRYETSYIDGSGIIVGEFANVTLADNAFIVDNEADDEYGKCGGVLVVGKLTMLGGEISKNNAADGGGVYVAGQFTMLDGRICDNNAAYGGGVYVEAGGVFEMTGGTINCNKDGAVYVSSYGTFRMGGSAYIPFGAYYDNVFETKRGDNDVQLYSSNGKAANITIISDLSEQAPVATFTTEDYTSKVLYAYSKGNDVEEDVTLLKKNYTKFTIMPRYYYSSFPHYYDYEILDNGQLQHNCPVKFYYDENGTETHGEPFTLIEGDNLTAPEQYLTRDGYQFLGWHRRKRVSWFDYEIATDSLKFPYTVGYEDDTIALVGQWARNTFYVKEGGDDENGGTDSGNDALATIAGAVRKMCNSNVDYTIVVSGTLVGQQAIADIMIVNPDVPGGDASTPIPARSITLCGETGNETDAIDCGWFLDESISEPSMRNRYGDEMEYGSALTINTVVPVTIEKLTITGGHVWGGEGAGVYVSNYSNVVIGKGASITDNNCSKDLDHAIGGDGGGVYVAPNANLSLTSEGLISENAAVNGGGVFVAENATFNIRGGLITGNGSSYGGGIYNKGSLAMTDGTIYANMVDQNGGGVYVDSSAVFAMGGGSIDNNDATKCGGGVFINGGRYGFGTMYMCDSAIVGRKVDETSSALLNAFMNSNQAANGGGVYVEGYASLYMGYSDSEHEAELKGGIFYNYANSAGGVYVNYGQEHGTLNVSSGYIASNGVRDFGAGVYLAANSNSDYSAVLNMKGGIIRGNDANGVNGKGSGVYMGVDDNYSSKFNISGAATVADGNDVYMSGEAATISIVGAISNQADVAKLTLAQHTNGRQLIEKENYDVTDAVFAAAIGKFTVAPYKVDESTTLNCYITNDGKLLIDVNIGEVIHQIQEATKYGDISVVGKMPENGIARIGGALRGKYDNSPEVAIALDLSGVFGMQTIPGYENGEPTNFAECMNLVSITLPEGITRIDSSAFKGCDYLAAVNIPEGVESIGNKAFEGCYLSEGITLPASVTSIGERCFAVCSFKSIIIPDGVKTISKYTFANCENLENIVLPQIDIVEESAFKNCKNLSTVYFKGSQADRNGISVEDENEPLVEAEWVYNYSPLYVSPGAEGASDENSGLSASEPLATLSGAISKMNNNSNNYYVFITGELTGAQTIPEEIGAQSITLVGARGISSEGIPQDGLYGNQEGTTLLVETNKPVTVKDLRITGGSASGLHINEGASVTIGQNTLIANNTSNIGGGVYNAGTLKMIEGQINGNVVEGAEKNYGGGVYNVGTFYMSGGRICNNKANGTYDCGGGVYNTGSMFMWDNAVVGDRSNEEAASNISNSNFAGFNGGGIYNQGLLYLGYCNADTKVALEGGIYYNYSNETGGGIYNNNYLQIGQVKMSSGNIAYNAANAERSGGGIKFAGNSLEKTSVSITGGKITGNSAGAGAGISSGYNVTLSISDAEISNNDATCKSRLNYTNTDIGGGGIAVENGTLILDGDTKITGNKSANHGGGINAWISTITMKGNTVISGNSISTTDADQYCGGAIYAANTTYLEFEGNSYIPYGGAQRQNDVILVSGWADNKITAGDLSENTHHAIATILLPEASYTEDAQVIYFPEGMETNDAAMRFQVANTDYYILNNGCLKSRYVDLGLPSGNLWAVKNLGANSPEDYGDYYAWGETSPYYSSLGDPTTWNKPDGYAWASYTKLSDGAVTPTFSKYNSTDGITTLEFEDDAATANLGSGSAMPTTADFQELKNYCRWEWDSNAKGYTVYSKAEGNNNSIFLPAAGGFADDGTTRTNAGIWGFYWTSSLKTADPANALHFEISSSKKDLTENGYPRKVGFTVRPVKRKN